MFRIAACDDDPAQIKLLQQYAERYSIQYDNLLEMDGYKSGESLLQTYEKGQYELIFMDVEMDKMDGIYVAERIRHIPDHDVIIMYVSNYPQYMQASFGVRAAQYLTKPLTYEIFEKKINEIFDYLKEEIERVFDFIYEGEHYLVKESEIISIESDGAKLDVYTIRDHIKPRGRLKDYINKCQKYMISPNRSMLINTKYISKFNGNNIVLTDKRIIPISRMRAPEIRAIIGKNITERLV